MSAFFCHLENCIVIIGGVVVLNGDAEEAGALTADGAGLGVKATADESVVAVTGAPERPAGLA